MQEDCFSMNGLRGIKITHSNLDALTYTESIFSNVSDVSLYVPEGKVDLYNQFYPWKNFKEIIEYKDQDDEFQFNAYSIEYLLPSEVASSRVTRTSIEGQSVYNKDYIASGISVGVVEAPNKEGYTFNGWDNVPEIMPSHDVSITGTYSINKYKLIYLVDGAEYKSYEVEYGTAITAEAEPTKEGYTFSGWSEIPETMPAKDVTVTGSFTENKVTKYTLTYKVDGEVYKTYELEEGAIITPEEVPTKEGYTFSGWSEIPEKMPAKDVIVTGSFTQIDYVIGDATYEVSGDEVSVIKGNNYTGDVEISSTIVINDKTYTVTSIAEGAFKNNTNITSVTIPESVNSIGANAFDGCSGLTSINVGKAVTSIGSKAFANLTSAAKTRALSGLTISCYATNVPTTASDAFENTSTSNATLLVDDNSVEAYKTSAPWSDFGTIMGFNEAAGMDGVLLDNGGRAKIFSIDGKPLNEPQKGVNIIRMDNGKTMKVVVK